MVNSDTMHRIPQELHVECPYDGKILELRISVYLSKTDISIQIFCPVLACIIEYDINYKIIEK